MRSLEIQVAVLNTHIDTLIAAVQPVLGPKEEN